MATRHYYLRPKIYHFDQKLMSSKEAHQHLYISTALPLCGGRNVYVFHCHKPETIGFGPSFQVQRCPREMLILCPFHFVFFMCFSRMIKFFFGQSGDTYSTVLAFCPFLALGCRSFSVATSAVDTVYTLYIYIYILQKTLKKKKRKSSRVARAER